ncbi:MAG: tRNA (adenosine(37)-N6)-threonylcarbamoyltransferase complex ATPase subunit type 1 TsaE [Pseudomonadota bacterium]
MRIVQGVRRPPKCRASDGSLARGAVAADMDCIMTVITFLVRNDAETALLGASMAPHLGPGDLIFLAGSLGAGKTTLARGLIQALCGPIDVPSPTYTLVETYNAPDFDISHLDLYRLAKPEDVWELGVEEIVETGVALIEWPERVGDFLPGGALEVRLSTDGDGRRIELKTNANWRNRIDRLAAEFENRRKGL